MIVDSSALLAIVLSEPDADRYSLAILGDPHARIPAVAWFEASMRVDWAGDPVASSRFAELPAILKAEIVPFTARHAECAREGRRLFGRSVHPAGLNFGDCLVYGVAKAEREPLLFKGNDFAQTDIVPALKD